MRAEDSRVKACFSSLAEPDNLHNPREQPKSEWLARWVPSLTSDAKPLALPGHLGHPTSAGTTLTVRACRAAGAKATDFSIFP